MSVEARNKAVLLEFLNAVGSGHDDAAAGALRVPTNYRVCRNAFANLRKTGRDIPRSGASPREAMPDRVGRALDIVAEGDKVWMLWTLEGTHRGNLLGIPPTGKRLELLEVGIFRLVDGKIAATWAIGDELDLVLQLGIDSGHGDGATVHAQQGPPSPGPSGTGSMLDHNKDLVLRLRSASSTGDQAALAELLAPGHTVRRSGFSHLIEAGRRAGAASSERDLVTGISERADRLEDIIAEADKVWALWRLTGTHTGTLFGIPPTGRSIAVFELGIYRIEDGRVAESWGMADQLGLLWQLGAHLPGRAD